MALEGSTDGTLTEGPLVRPMIRLAWPLVVIQLLQVVQGAFRGAGNTKTALAFAVIGLWLVRVPVTCYLVFVADWGPTGVWTGILVGDVVGALAAVAWFARGTWKTSLVDRDESATRGSESAADSESTAE